VYQSLGRTFINISSPLPAEGYINFGWMGSLLFTAIVALLACCYDAAYWLRPSRRVPTFHRLFYPAAIILFLFLLRGDLLSSFAYLAGFYVSGRLFHAVLNRKAADGPTG
jgi:hypothetical protein